MGRATGLPRLRGAGRQYLWESVYRMANDEASSAFRGSLPVTTRHPLLHRPLVEFMLALPADLRASPADDRILQRRALVDRLPDAIRTRKTKGSDQRIRDRLQGQSPEWMAMMADRPRIVERGWVDGDLWRAQLQRARFGLVDGLGSFSAAMSAEAWLRAWQGRSG
jgi:asparagine synthase (glutamine-hydrolysing)